MRRAIPAAILAAALVVPQGSAAAVRKPSNQWATVNICDSAKNPNRLGVRARMPGDGTRERIYMRFTAQYRAGKAWKQVAGRGVSPWFYAGSALFTDQELGYTFSFDPPKAGTSYVMRGLVNFEWRAQHHVHGKLHTVVSKRAYAYTSAGHPTSQAEPPGFSTASCRLQPAPAGAARSAGQAQGVRAVVGTRD